MRKTNENKTLIKESFIKESIHEEVRNFVKEQLKEAIVNSAYAILKEDEKLNRKMNKRRKDDQKKDKQAKREFVLNKLKSGEVNNAELMRKLWNVKQGSDEDDVYRSLFSKNVRQEKDPDTGGIRRFTDDEILRLAQMIHDIGA